MIKKLSIAIGIIAALLAVALYGILPVLINKETLKSDIITSFKTLTGLDLEIQGDAVLQNFPLPHVIINAIDVHNAQGAVAPFLLTARVIDVYPDIFSLLTGTLNINTMAIDGVNLELERLKTNTMNWQAVNASGNTPAQSSRLLKASSLKISNATIRYTDSVTGGVTELKNVNLSLNSGMTGKNALDMQMVYAGQPCSITGSLANLASVVSSGSTSAGLNVTCGNSHLAYQGDLGFKDNNYYIAGAADFLTADVAPWVNFWLGKTDKVELSDAIFKPLPLEAKTRITTQANKITFNEFSLSGAILTGKVAASITLPYHMDVNATLDNFDLETVLASKLFDPKIASLQSEKSSADIGFTPTPAIVGLNPVINAIDVNAEIALADMKYNNQDIKDTHLTFTMNNGEMSIPQFGTKLPGNSRIIFTGLGKQGYQGFTLEGQMDSEGDDFAEMLHVFKPKGFSMPPEDFKRFRIRSNLSLSMQEIRLSEIAARIENIAFVGGIITTLGDHIKIQSALRIDGINMDHFIKLWGLEEWRSSFLQESLAPKSDALMALWLKQLGFDLSLNASVEQSVLSGKMRDRVDLNLMATAGKIILSNIKTTYDNSPVAGALALDITGPLPRVDVQLATDKLNLNSVFSIDPARPSKDRWSSNEVDFHWLELLNGSYNFRIGHVKYNNLEAANVAARGTLDGASISLDSLSMAAFGAQSEMKGAIKGGKIPIITLAANVQGLDNSQLVPYLPVLAGLSGQYNLNIQLQTNGNNEIAWIGNLGGGVGIGGRNITVHGFNLAGIVSSIAYVRSVADILNVVKRAFPGGDTIFSTMEGQWVISQGRINLSNTRLNNDLTRGVFDGQADLINWLLQGKATFELDSLHANPPPSIGVVLDGTLDNPQKTLDTLSLEQYITGKTSERMLQNYGTH